MEVTASLVIMSHISDIQCAEDSMSKNEKNERLNFVKYIILHTKGNLKQKIDPDILWGEFKQRFK